MLVRQTKPFASGIDKFRAGLAVRFVSSRNFGNSFADQSVRDDELRSSVIIFFRVIERVQKCLHVLAVDFLNVESVGLESRGCVFALSRGRGRVERDRVGIVNQNQIIEAKMSGERTRLCRNAFLQTTVARETNTM